MGRFFVPGAAVLGRLSVHIGHAFKEAGRREPALRAYRFAIACAPRRHDIRVHLAHYLKNSGLLDEAKAEFLRLRDGAELRWQSEAAEQLAAIAMLNASRERQAGDWGAVAQAYALATQMAPDNAALKVQLGHALKEAQRWHEAANAYRAATVQAPDHADAWLHLAHVLRRIGPRAESVRAYAQSWVLGERSAESAEALKNAVGYRAREVRAAITEAAMAAGLPLGAMATELADLTGDDEPEASVSLPQANECAIIYLSAIDWDYRRQRPQHMACALAAAGHAVCFVSTVIDAGVPAPGFRVLRELAPGLVEVRLQLPHAGSGSIHFETDATTVSAAGEALGALLAALETPAVIVDHPSWYAIVMHTRLPGPLVYDCIDNISGFADAAPQAVAAERRLIVAADVVLASSQAIVEAIAPVRPAVLVPNGAQTDRFCPIAEIAPASDTVEIIYFGMVSYWFDAQWVAQAARAHPEWVFRIIGEVAGNAADPMRGLANVDLVGEVPYEQLGAFLASARVGIIPFKINDLTESVNPVKLYEYLAAGRPVVASAMRELIGVPDVRTAATADEFTAALAAAVHDHSQVARARRSTWAQAHDWRERAARVRTALGAVSLDAHADPASSPPAPKPNAAVAPSLPCADFVLFVAPFPKTGTVVEGWMGRIRAVDEVFAKRARIYFNFALTHPADAPPQLIQHDVCVYEFLLHPDSARHADLIDQAIAQCRFCYVHTVHLAKHVLGYYATGKIVTDFHGVAPEEERMMGRPEAADFYEGVECTVLHASRQIVVVTRAMADYLRQKYPDARFKEWVLPIIMDYPSPSPTVRKGDGTRPVIIYSGGAQVWQNVDLMLSAMSATMIEATYRIASHDHRVIAHKAEVLGIDQQIKFGVYGREELPDFYAGADFGFVLRDDDPVNRVACPTKLTEYLEFGVIPIIKLAEIGDFASEGYQYVTADEFAAGIIPGQAQRRRMIAQNRLVLQRLRDCFAQSAAELRDLTLASRLPRGGTAGLPTRGPAGIMPWQREVYVFGDKTTYQSAVFLSAYTRAHFDLPDGTTGTLVRIVPMVGSFVTRIDEVVITVDGDVTDLVPVVVQSRATPGDSGDHFSALAPFVEIKLSACAVIAAITFTLESLLIGETPVSSVPEQPRQLRVTIRGQAGHASHDLPVAYIGLS